MDPFHYFVGKIQTRLANIRVVITGAPGTGKTAIVKTLEAMGYPCHHEIIREMTSSAREGTSQEISAPNPLLFVDDAMEFNRQLLLGREKQFLRAAETAGPINFFDRGIPDVLAYMDFFDQPYGKEFKRFAQDHRYDAVFFVPPWEDIYVRDNERLESFPEAEALHHSLVDTYTQFGYIPVEVPKDTVANRISFILETLKKA